MQESKRGAHSCHRCLLPDTFFFIHSNSKSGKCTKCKRKGWKECDCSDNVCFDCRISWLFSSEESSQLSNSEICKGIANSLVVCASHMLSKQKPRFPTEHDVAAPVRILGKMAELSPTLWKIVMFDCLLHRVEYPASVPCIGGILRFGFVKYINLVVSEWNASLLMQLCCGFPPECCNKAPFPYNENFELVLQDALDGGADLTQTNEDGNTVMHFATQHPDSRILAKLLELGGNPNTRNKDGCTPLHYAITHRVMANVRLLLDSKATFNIDMFGQTPYQRLFLGYGLTDKTHAFIVESFKNRSNDVTTLSIMQLLAAHFNYKKLDHRDSQGLSALWLACREGFKEVVKFLASNDCDPAYYFYDKGTFLSPLQVCIERNHPEIAVYLISKGACTHFLPNLTNGKTMVNIYGVLIGLLKASDQKRWRWFKSEELKSPCAQCGLDPQNPQETFQLRKQVNENKRVCGNPNCSSMHRKCQDEDCTDCPKRQCHYLKACSRCETIKYCSKECQRAHWPIHKPSCVDKSQEFLSID